MNRRHFLRATGLASAGFLADPLRTSTLSAPRKGSWSFIHYTDVHVNLCSTMAIDGAAHGKPQIAPFYDKIKAEKELRNLYYQEHYQTIIF